MTSLFSLLAFSLLPLSALSATPLAPGQITDFVTFGDSYTDVVWSPGGVPWPFWARDYSGARVHPFARAGGTCSNNITARPFPSVYEGQIPEYDRAFGRGPGAVRLDGGKTLHMLWIGTNDLGSNALLTSPGTSTIVDVTKCAVGWVKTLYDLGARNFLFQNVRPMWYSYGEIADEFIDYRS
jgi:hypothetical protein